MLCCFAQAQGALSRGKLSPNGSGGVRRWGGRGAAAGLRNTRGRRERESSKRYYSYTRRCEFFLQSACRARLKQPLPKGGSSGWGVPPSVISAHGIHAPWLELDVGVKEGASECYVRIITLVLTRGSSSNSLHKARLRLHVPDFAQGGNGCCCKLFRDGRVGRSSTAKSDE